MNREVTEAVDGLSSNTEGSNIERGEDSIIQQTANFKRKIMEALAQALSLNDTSTFEALSVEQLLAVSSLRPSQAHEMEISDLRQMTPIEIKSIDQLDQEKIRFLRSDTIRRMGPPILNVMRSLSLEEIGRLGAETFIQKGIEWTKAYEYLSEDKREAMGTSVIELELNDLEAVKKLSLEKIAWLGPKNIARKREYIEFWASLSLEQMKALGLANLLETKALPYHCMNGIGFPAWTPEKIQAMGGEHLLTTDATSTIVREIGQDLTEEQIRAGGRNLLQITYLLVIRDMKELKAEKIALIEPKDFSQLTQNAVYLLERLPISTIQTHGVAFICDIAKDRKKTSEMFGVRESGGF